MSETRLDPATLRALIAEIDQTRIVPTDWVSVADWLQAKLDALPEDGEVQVDFGDSGMERRIPPDLAEALKCWRDSGIDESYGPDERLAAAIDAAKTRGAL